MNPYQIWRKLKSAGVRGSLRDFYEYYYVDKILKHYYLRNGQVNIINRTELPVSSDVYWESDDASGYRIPVRDGINKCIPFCEVPYQNTTESGIYEFHDASILAPGGLGISKEGNCIADTVGLPSEDKRRVSIALSMSALKSGKRWTNDRLSKKPNNKNVCCELDIATAIIPLWKNYYHWMVECLPRLRSVQIYEKKSGRAPTVLLPKDRTSWMDDVLRILDLDIEYKEINFGETKVEKLVVPTYPDPSPSDIFWLKSNILKDYSSESSQKRIFISRSDATTRRLKNIDVIRSILKKYSIDEYVLSNLSVKEQARLFADADLIISPHGAGLSNIIFCDQNVSIIELFGERKRTSYYRIAKIMGFSYRSISGESSGPDIIIDPTELKSKLQNYFNNE